MSLAGATELASGPPLVLDVRGLTRRLPSQGGTLTFSLRPGEVMGVIGPSNSGKSHLLASLAGLAHVPSGTVFICGQPLTKANGHLVGYVPSSPGVYEEFRCREYLDFFAESFGVDRHYRCYLVWEALRRVRLLAYAEKAVGELPFSARRRLGLARALVHDPALIIINDVLERLERNEAREMVDILLEVRNQGKALVVSSPSLSELSRLCSHLCILVTDRPLACGEKRHLIPQIANLRMMQVQFLAGFGSAVRFLEKYAGVFHLSVSTHTHNLVRFLFDGDDQAFLELLNSLKNQGCSVVSFAEDHSFLGKDGLG